jgi:hypothetical protein
LADGHVDDGRGYVRVQRFAQGLQFGGEYFYAGQIVLRPLARHRRDQQLALLRDQQVFAENLASDRAGGVDGQRGMTLVVHPGHLLRVLEHLLDLVAEPDIHRFVDQPARDERQQHRRNEREPNEGGDQLRAEAGPQQTVPSLEVRLDEASGEQEGQHHQADQVQIDQQQHKGIAGAG